MHNAYCTKRRRKQAEQRAGENAWKKKTKKRGEIKEKGNGEEEVEEGAKEEDEKEEVAVTGEATSSFSVSLILRQLLFLTLPCSSPPPAHLSSLSLFTVLLFSFSSCLPNLLHDQSLDFLWHGHGNLGCSKFLLCNSARPPSLSLSFSLSPSLAFARTVICK